MGPMHCDILFQDHLILNGLIKDLGLVLPTSRVAFQVVNTELILYVCKVKVTSSVTLGYMAALKQMTAKYSIQQVDCKVLCSPGFSIFQSSWY